MNLFGYKEELDLPVIPHSHSVLDSAVYSRVGKMPRWLLVATLRFTASQDDGTSWCSGPGHAGKAAV